MKKYTTRIIAIVPVALTIAFSACVIDGKLPEDRYNKIMCYYIARNATLNMNTAEEKVCALRNFVHINIHPVTGYDNRLDTVAIDKLVDGIGWCDQQARVFMQLARSIGINTRLLFLRYPQGGSPHSVAEAQMPDGRWVIVDPFYNLDLRNKKGELATQKDIKEDPSILTENNKIKLRKKYIKKWEDPRFLAIYYSDPKYVIEKAGVKLDLLGLVPLSWIRAADKIIADFYIGRMNHACVGEFDCEMLRARTYHLLGYYRESEELYRDIIRRSANKNLVHKAEYYAAKLFKQKKQYEDSMLLIDQAVKNEIKNPYRVYLIGMKGRIFEQMGEAEKAIKEQKKIEYMLRAM